MCTFSNHIQLMCVVCIYFISLTICMFDLFAASIALLYCKYCNCTMLLFNSQNKGVTISVWTHFTGQTDSHLWHDKTESKSWTPTTQEFCTKPTHTSKNNPDKLTIPASFDWVCLWCIAVTNNMKCYRLLLCFQSYSWIPDVLMLTALHW